MKSLEFLKPTLATTLAIVLAWLLSVRPAQAGYVVTLQQVGPDVVATGSGAINLHGLTFYSIVFRKSRDKPRSGDSASIYTGPTSSTVDLYYGPQWTDEFRERSCKVCQQWQRRHGRDIARYITLAYFYVFSVFQRAMSPVLLYRTARPTAARLLQP